MDVPIAWHMDLNGAQELQEHAAAMMPMKVADHLSMPMASAANKVVETWCMYTGQGLVDRGLLWPMASWLLTAPSLNLLLLVQTQDRI